MKKKTKGYSIIEVMVVIVILGLILSVVMRNTSGSLEEGKAFKTEQGSQQIQEILAMQIALGASADDVRKNPEIVLKNARVFKDSTSVLKDGWGIPYVIEVTDDDEVFVRSERFLAYVQKQKNIDDAAARQKYSWMFPPTNSSGVS